MSSYLRLKVNETLNFINRKKTLKEIMRNQNVYKLSIKNLKELGLIYIKFII